ncbi:uncharacterized protein TNCV_3660611 [Trichonephila clavipes]|nr:uncharacterized protein TNCV_3660611 [Trichonephila clavipes]
MIMHDLIELRLLGTILRVTVWTEWMANSIVRLIEHLWEYLDRQVTTSSPPPRSLHELEQGLLRVSSSLPISVFVN